MTITGENFGTNLTAIVVRFDEVRSETPTSASATQLVVPVPNGIPGLSRSSDLKFVNIVVSVTGRDSDPFPQNIQVL
jgi:hypothetical protein